VPSVMNIPADTQVRLAISQIDLLEISFHAEFVETMGALADTAAVLP